MLWSSDRFPLPLTRVRTRLRALSVGVALATLAVAQAATAAAPENLGNGLKPLLESHLATAGLSGTALQSAAPFGGYTSEQVAMLAHAAITDANGRVLVRIYPDGAATATSLRAGLQKKSAKSQLTSVEITAIDEKYRGVGVMNAYVSLDDVDALARMPGVRSVILELKPRLAQAHTDSMPGMGPNAHNGDTFNKLGTAFDQGVTQHRVDQINHYYNASASADWEGNGISVGMLSDSYANAGSATADVASFDLPGAATNPVNINPVVVLQDSTTGEDEGRAMIQIGYKMAPKAKFAFATAEGGEVGFANNIRALAGIPAFIYPGQTFAADVIADDVGYFDEPYFQDGIIGQAINDVAAIGVSHFTSAGNDIGVNGYESDLRWVPNGTGLTAAAGNTALQGTNIDLTGVPAGLYAGGFHNFNPNVGAQDVAQLVNIQSNANEPATVLQWNEPYDQNASPGLIDPPIFTGHGNITGATPVTFTVPATLTAGALYELDSTADSGTSPDSIVTIKDPGGNIIIDHQDTQIDEKARFFAPVTGANYTIQINSYNNTTGPFTVKLYSTSGFTGPMVSTQINLLVFDAAGHYVPADALTSNVMATNQPIQLGYTLRSGGNQLQYVISRSNVPAPGPTVATHIRYTIAGNGLPSLGPAEYVEYNAATTGGHAMAAGNHGTAAYSVFRPNLAQNFTSPGPVVIYYDTDGNRLNPPEVRQQPIIAAANGANTSFFTDDDSEDPDTNPNFYGTSAAAPHAAAIAALVLEAKGGHHSVTPAQMTTMLTHSTFAHDLDPSSVSGVARTASGDKIAIRFTSDGSNNLGTGGQDANAFTVSYNGTSSITSLVFNPTGSAATAGNVTGGNSGVLNVTGSSPATVSYFENNFAGSVFMPGSRAFTVGNQSTVVAGSVTAAYSNTAPSPSTTQSWTMTLNVTPAAFSDGKTLRFTVGRGEQHSAVTGNTGTIGNGSTLLDYIADIFGGGVYIPSGTVQASGMTFSGTTANGGTFSGMLRNRLGAGYTRVDGYGFINAEQAVSQPVP